MLTRNDTDTADPGSGPITGERAVPSLARKWSHPTGETHTQTVPCRWRATATMQLHHRTNHPNNTTPHLPGGP